MIAGALRDMARAAIAVDRSRKGARSVLMSRDMHGVVA